MSSEIEPQVTPRRPGRWVLHKVEHSAWFTTRVTWTLPDGRRARWSSRLARRRGRVELRDQAGEVTGVVEAEPITAARLVRINAVAAVSFVLGGGLFALGALLAQQGSASIRAVDVTYLVGGVFFSLGGYASVLQATNTPTDIDEQGALSSRRWRWWRSEPSHIGWLSAVVLFVGTLFFAVSLVAAFADHLTPRQTNGWIWFPDIAGCVMFLVSGHLALLEVSNGPFARRLADLGWWIVAVNQLGSVLFFLAGLAAFVRPATSQAWNVGMVNWGTFLGALCFVVAAVMQLFERPTASGDGASTHDP